MLSTLHVRRVIASAFCITWPTCLGKLQPASVYMWIPCTSHGMFWWTCMWRNLGPLHCIQEKADCGVVSRLHHLPNSFHLMTLPMGWTNLVPIFHDITFILQAEILHITIPYINDVPVKGPKSTYSKSDKFFETIPKNSGIHWFVWEHFKDLNRVVQRIKYCRGTFSSPKLLCVPNIFVLGHRCTPEGRLPNESRVPPICKWGPCKGNLTDLRRILHLSLAKGNPK
jgi:hypothetical protein